MVLASLMLNKENIVQFVFTHGTVRTNPESVPQFQLSALSKKYFRSAGKGQTGGADKA